DEALHDLAVVLNAASPFPVTVYPLVEACLRTGTHYLDINEEVTIRREEVMTSVPLGALERSFDYSEGDRLSTAVSWADVFTAFLTTGIPNIEVYVEMNLLEKGVY